MKQKNKKKKKKKTNTENQSEKDKEINIGKIGEERKRTMDNQYEDKENFTYIALATQ